MSRYFSVMTDIIRRHQGTLDKYMGDAVMAFWGAPLDDAEHAEHAVQAAWAMQAALPALNEEFEAQGWPQLRLSIGLNSGRMVVGDLGSRHRRAYTVLGDAVNLAARLQELCAQQDLTLLLGEATWAALPPDSAARCQSLGPQQLRGREAAVQVYKG